jgi:hypothetical protein
MEVGCQNTSAVHHTQYYPSINHNHQHTTFETLFTRITPPPPSRHHKPPTMATSLYSDSIDDALPSPHDPGASFAQLVDHARPFFHDVHFHANSNVHPWVDLVDKYSHIHGGGGGDDGGGGSDGHDDDGEDDESNFSDFLMMKMIQRSIESIC